MSHPSYPMTKQANTTIAYAASEAGSDTRAYREQILLGLLILTTVGQLVGNIALFHVGDFAATLPYFSFGGAALIMLFSRVRTRANGGIALIWLFMIFVEILFHGVLLGSIANSDWQRSVAQYIFFSFCFVLTSRLQLDRLQLLKIAPLLEILAVLFGGLGLLQFVLSNLKHIFVSVPPVLSAYPWDPSVDIYRTSGFYRSYAFAREPSSYANGLSLLLVLLVFLDGLRFSQSSRKHMILPLLLLVSGSIVSFSFAGWFLGIGSLLIALVVGRMRGYLRLGMITVLFLSFMLYQMKWPPAIMERATMILEGTDRSLQVRAISPLRAFFASSQDFSESMLGDGMGQEENYRSLIESTYLAGYSGTSVHNTFTLIKITQGWLGLALHLLLLFAIVCRRGREYSRNYAVILAGVFLFHFSAGLFLSPVYWGLLALLRVLYNTELHPIEMGSQLSQGERLFDPVVESNHLRPRRAYSTLGANPDR